MGDDAITSIAERLRVLRAKNDPVSEARVTSVAADVEHET